MATVYCQNKNCQYFKTSKSHKFYGKCTRKVLHLTTMDDESYEVSGYSVACPLSTIKEYESEEE